MASFVQQTSRAHQPTATTRFSAMLTLLTLQGMVLVIWTGLSGTSMSIFTVVADDVRLGAHVKTLQAQALLVRLSVRLA